MASWYFTRGITFSARSMKRGGGFCVRGGYWKRPGEQRDPVDVNSTQLGYNSGAGCFESKDEAKVHIELFRIHVEQQRNAVGGGAGGGGAGRRKQYSAATRGDTRSGGRDESKAKAAVEKRPLKEPGGGHAKKKKLTPGLDASLRARRALAFSQKREWWQRAWRNYNKRKEKVDDWMAWRCRVMKYLKQHIEAGTTWQLMDGGSQAPQTPQTPRTPRTTATANLPPKSPMMNQSVHSWMMGESHTHINRISTLSINFT